MVRSRYENRLGEVPRVRECIFLTAQGGCLVRSIRDPIRSHAHRISAHTEELKVARIRFVVAASYLAIVLALWLPFNPRSGMPYETGFAYTSEISTWWNGFLHGADYLRIYTSIFYQVAYLMGELSGFGGSFVPYQIVYAALWWARGFLVFLIGRRLAPGHDLFWYLAGALVLVHSSDQTVGWVGQLNQSGFAVWTMLSFYMLVLAFQQTDRMRADFALVAGIFFEHLVAVELREPVLDNFDRAPASAAPFINGRGAGR